MGAIQSQVDVYKGRSPLSADRHMQNIAKSLAKDYGITSIGDIGVRQVPHVEYIPIMGGIGESEYIAGYQPVERNIPEYFNKNDPSKIIPASKFASEGAGDGYSNYNLQPVQQADGSTIVLPVQQYSKSGLGAFVEDFAPALSAASAILAFAGVPPLYLAAGNVALQAGAGNVDNIGDALKVAAPHLIPHLISGGLKELASAGNLSSLAGSADFVPTAATSAGKIAEAVGIPSAFADAAGKAGVAALRSGLTDGDIGKAILMSQLPSPGSFVKNALDFSRGIAGFDIGDTSEFDANALRESDGWNSWEGGDNAPSWNSWEGGDNTVDVYGALELPPGAKPDEAKLPEPYLLNPDAVLDPVTIRPKLGDYDEEDLYAPLGLPPGAEPDEAKLPEPYLLNPGAANVDVETANMVKIDGREYFLNNQGGASVQNPDGSYTNLNAREFADLGEPDQIVSDATLDPVTIRPNNEYKLDYDPNYVTPPGQGMVDDTWTTEDIPYELPNDPNYVTPPGQGMVDDTWTNEGIPSVAPSQTTKPSEPTKPKLDLRGLLSLFALGSMFNGSMFNQPKIDANFENFQSPTDLKGGYSFDWNAQPFKQPEGGNAYSQDYYGQHWNKTMAQGGITSIPFAHTVGDSGVHANKPSSIAAQVIQHLRSGGHVMDDKAHSAVKYLASKGEPVHHIVGFMKHRMAAGGITSLGSYSDGGQLLKGPGDGMSDDIPATIADKQPARLANEEFVIPADVVSHLGNGSSESGAKVLYDMMAKVRKARTGNPKQGKQIDAHKFMPKV